MFTYPLPASTIPSDKLHEEQKQITTAFLTKMGYLHTYPQSVAHAPKTQGGARLCHLSTKHGAQKVLQIIKHMQANMMLGTVYIILINHYQLNSGLSQPILKHTTKLPWSQAYWFDTLCEFLNQIQGKILLENLWITHQQQANNQHIMQALLQANLPLMLHDYKVLNNIHIHLQVNTSSEISNHAGMHLCHECMHAPTPLPNKQQCHPNHSTLQWPNHTTPSTTNWKLWNQTIHKILLVSNMNKLTQPLGMLNEHYQTDYQWNWTICPTTYNLYHCQDTVWMQYHPTTLHQTYVQYQDKPESIHDPLTCLPPVTPELKANGIQIVLPMTLLPQLAPKVAHNPEPLICQLIAPPHLWASTLWHSIQPHANLYTLHKTLGQGCTVIIASKPQ